MRETIFFQQGKVVEVKLYSLRNSSGFGVDITNLGAGIINLFTPDRNGDLRDVALGFQRPTDYLRNHPCFGAVIGRVAGRIKNASVNIAGKTYRFPANENGNLLHSGGGWRTAIYQADPDGDTALSLRRTDPAGVGRIGFPGNLDVEIIYQVTEDNELIIDYAAKSDAATVVNMTNHVYLNLNGAGAGSIARHDFAINSSEYLELDAEKIPTGRRIDVAGTPFDLRTLRQFGSILPQLPGGFDHYFVLETVEPGFVDAVAYSPDSGIELRFYTTELGIQFYTANGFNGKIFGKQNRYCQTHDGFAMEAMGYPDACHHRSKFPPVELAPGDAYRQRTIYKFSTRN